MENEITKALDNVDAMSELSSTGTLGSVINFFINFWNEILYPIFGFMVPVSGIAGGIGGIMDVVIK